MSITMKLSYLPLFFLLLAAAPPRQNLWQEIAGSRDVAWLETVAAMKDDAPTMMLHQSAKTFRTRAYARLGAIGTAESLAAVDRIEARARQWRPHQDDFSEGVIPHPGWHMSNGVMKSNSPRFCMTAMATGSQTPRRDDWGCSPERPIPTEMASATAKTRRRTSPRRTACPRTRSCCRRPSLRRSASLSRGTRCLSIRSAALRSSRRDFADR